MGIATSKHRLGIVPYSNVAPLLEGLGEHYPDTTWVRATPRRLAELMQSNEIDIATLPIIEILRHDGYQIIPGCSISCDGPVRSVQLFSNVDVPSIRHILLDRSSLTSIHLARILISDQMHISPEYTLSDKPVSKSFDLAGSPYDAVVAIGDVALDWHDKGRFPHAVDLGEAWHDLTGLPFVFAAWIARPGVNVHPGDIMAFINARRAGQGQIYQIAKRLGGDDPAAQTKYVDYLSRAIHYKLTERHVTAIAEFRRRLLAHGLVSEGTGRYTLLERPPDSRSVQLPAG